MAGYRCSVCGVAALEVNACGCLPALEPLPEFGGLDGAELGRVVLLFVMSSGREYACSLAELEAADHYGVSVVGGLGGRAADPRVLDAVTDARGRIARAIDVKRSYQRAEEQRARAALADAPATTSTGSGSGGARVLRPVPPDTRPPGGVGAVVQAPAARSVGGWDF